jgi:hypothetical protein
MFSWVRDQPDRDLDLDGLIEEIDHLFPHLKGVYKGTESGILEILLVSIDPVKQITVGNIVSCLMWLLNYYSELRYI